VLLAACSGSIPAPQTATPVHSPVSVRVVSYNWADLRIFAVIGTDSHRLGTITPNSTRTYRIPDGLVAGRSSIRLAVRPIGSSELFTTETILFRPGDVIEWRVEEQLDQSRIFLLGG
jgi:hypothetical protein